MSFFTSVQIRVTPVKPKIPGSTDSVFIVCLHLGTHAEFASVGDKGDGNRDSQWPLAVRVTAVTSLSRAVSH